MLTVDQIVTQIVNQLRLSDPTVSAEVGTPERGLIEATSELIASQQVDFTVLNQQHDLSSMSSGRLDAYLSIFNFGRQQATPSYGTVTFGTTLAASIPITIGVGTQVIANINDAVFPSLTFVTTQTVVLPVGATHVDAPVQCTIAGTVGNIDSNGIVGFGSLRSIQGISTITNAANMTGGVDQEIDSDYKARFQNTFLRNVSGTTDMFLALAVAANGITKANVVGPISRYQEYLQVPAADDVAQVTPGGGYDLGGVQASALLTSDNTEPADGDTVTIHNVTYRFKNTMAAANDVKRSASSADTDLGNLVKAVNQTGTPGTEYYAGTVAPTDVTAGAVTAHTVTFKSKTYLAAANAYASTETSSHLSFGAATFTGGVNATYPHKRTTAESTIPYSKTTYSLNYYLTNGTLDPSTAKFYKPGVDYVFNTPPITAGSGTTQVVDSGHPYTPNVTFLNLTGSDLSGGDIVLLEHAYISINSRNDLSYGILNCVDVFVNGEQSLAADSVEVVPTSSNNLQSTTATLWTYQHPSATTVINFRRAVDGRACAVGSKMQPLYWQPVVDVPDSIQIGTATYYKGNYYNSGDSTYYNLYDGTTYSVKAHYVLALEVNSYYGTVRARNGLEWFLSGNNYLDGQLPTDDVDSYTGPKIDALIGTQFTINGYLYDRNVSDLQATMEQNKQTTTDVLVHKAKLRYFQPIVTVMYSFGSTQSVVNASIAAALANFFETQYYGQAVQLSDILQVIHNVPGVDNVRWTNSDTDGDKVQEVNKNGSAIVTGAIFYTTDFFIQDNELAQSPDDSAVTITVRAQNTWGT